MGIGLAGGSGGSPAVNKGTGSYWRNGISMASMGIQIANGGFHKWGGIPKNGWFIVEKHIKVGDLGVSLYFRKPPNRSKHVIVITG